MRTTLTLDDDVADKLKQFAHRRRLSFRAAVNAVIRQGLVSEERRGPSARCRLRSFTSPLRPGIDPLRLNHLADDLELERTGRPLRR
jgi:plasmid stability protein